MIIRIQKLKNSELNTHQWLYKFLVADSRDCQNKKKKLLKYNYSPIGNIFNLNLARYLAIQKKTQKNNNFVSISVPETVLRYNKLTPNCLNILLYSF